MSYDIEKFKKDLPPTGTQRKVFDFILATTAPFHYEEAIAVGDTEYRLRHPKRTGGGGRSRAHYVLKFLTRISCIIADPDTGMLRLNPKFVPKNQK